MLFIPAIPVLDSTFDLTAVSFISALIILSVLSLCFIFHLHFKSKFLPHLQDFNSLWTVRFLLVFFIFLWAIVELLRLPFLRRRYLYAFLPTLGITQQADLCKLHIAFSLGFFEPAFLVTLLFLVNCSTRKKTPDDIWAISFVMITCLPNAAVQTLSIYFRPLELKLPSYFHVTSVVLKNGVNGEAVLCSYPLLNSLLFGAFGVTYVLCLLVSCSRVLSLVINKGLRARIYALAFVVVISLPLQIVSLMMSALWNPDEEAYGVISLIVFLGAFCCAAVAEGVLVIKPIADALEASGNCWRWTPEISAEGSPVTGERNDCNA